MIGFTLAPVLAYRFTDHRLATPTVVETTKGGRK
jgi:hypothetical protein